MNVNGNRRTFIADRVFTPENNQIDVLTYVFDCANNVLNLGIRRDLSADYKLYRWI
jgi:hypothetical protein